MVSFKKILIADDDPDILDQMKVQLEGKGFKVIGANSANEAYKLFESEKPDAVASDLMMEEMDSGFLLSYKIKKTAYGKTIPVFVLTSATYVTGYKFDVFTGEEKDWLKCDGIMNKPIQVDDLIEKIERYYEAKV